MENTGNFNSNAYGDNEINYKKGEKIQFPTMNKVYNLSKQLTLANRIS